jgi:hypothetical protein
MAAYDANELELLPLDAVVRAFKVWSLNELLGTVAPPAPTAPPVVAGFSPSLASPIGSITPLSFMVQPVAPATLQRVIVLVSFPMMSTYEVAHDGAAFSESYPLRLGNSRTVVGDAVYFTLLRKEGWPASPRIIPMAVDEYGNMNPVDSVIYAWTLV